MKQEALEQLQQAHTMAQSINMVAILPRIINSIGFTFITLQDWSTADSHFMECLTQAKSIGDRYTEAVAFTNLGASEFYQKKFGKSIHSFHQGLTIHKEIFVPGHFNITKVEKYIEAAKVKLAN